MDIPGWRRVNRLTGMVPKVLNISLEESLKQSPDLKGEYDGDNDIRKPIDIAMKLEGTNRNAGTHAAGVVIANGPITDYVPVMRITRKDGEETATDPLRRNGSWAISKKSACSRWTSWPAHR